MKSSTTLAASFLLCIAGGASKKTVGKAEYMVACAGCHGETGKGDGPIAGLLEINTPDLTRLTHRAGGDAFPFENTLRLIDGRNDIRAHGSSMPVWGDRYLAAALDTEAASEQPEAAQLAARGRLLALVDYLKSIQE